MLLLSFHIGSERYAVSAKQIIEILPLTSIKRIPRAPAYVAGLLDYRGLPVPVIDLCQLINEQDCSKVLSSRIILINYKAGDGKVHPLGLIAEKVTETLNIAEEHFTSSGISMEGMAYLGGVAKNNGSMVQYIEIDELLSNELQTMLFVDNSERRQASNQ